MEEENSYELARRLQRERFEAQLAGAKKPAVRVSRSSRKNIFHPIDGSSAMSYFNKRDSIRERSKR